MYDYVIVGSGLFGCTFANLAKTHNKKCLIIEKKNHTFGNCYTENLDSIIIHKYGPHIFHTNSDKIWQYINQFGTFNNYINRPKVIFKDNLYSFPINLMTLYQMWGIKNPTEAIERLNSCRIHYDHDPQNLEEWILSQVGEEIYYTFIYGYTKKQWNTEPKNLPSFIIKRLPIRFNFDDNYFFDKYQGIPIDGYSSIMSNMIDGIETVTDTNYFSQRDYWDSLAKQVVYTGPIDDFFDHIHGKLEYRGLKFDLEKYDANDYQGNAIINYTDYTVPYTRIIEHKHFTFGDNQNFTYITKEFPSDCNNSEDKYYPINNEINTLIYNKYYSLIKQTNNKYIFGGRLAEYKYYDMHQIIASAFNIYYKNNE